MISNDEKIAALRQAQALSEHEAKIEEEAGRHISAAHYRWRAHALRALLADLEAGEQPAPTHAEKIAALRRIVQACDNESSYLHNHPDRLAYRALLADLEAGEQGWRPIADNPPNDTPVLVHDGLGTEIAWRKGNHWRSHIDILQPRYWHPLPQPPAESREEDLCNRPGCGPEFCRNDTDCPRITGTPDAPSPVGGADPPDIEHHEHHWIGGNDGLFCTDCGEEAPFARAAAPAPTAGDAVERGRDGHGEHCWYCGDRCNGFAGNPGLWPLLLPLDDARPGHCVAVHTRCVLDRLKRAGEVARAERAALLEKIRGHTPDRARILVNSIIEEALSGDQP